MKVIQNAAGEIFAGYKPVQGRMAGFKPFFVTPRPGEAVQVAAYENAIDAYEVVKELNSKGHQVFIADLVLKGE